MTKEELRQFIKKVQEPKGFFLNAQDEELVDNLLEGLLQNKERYGFMACPCRLSSGDRQKDRDLVCPCAYRQDDIDEYGSCFCGLYVSDAWNKNQIPHVEVVPDRRPPEKVV